MKLSTVLRLMRYWHLLETILGRAAMLKDAPKGMEVPFSGVRITVNGKHYEVRGVIVKLED